MKYTYTLFTFYGFIFRIHAVFIFLFIALPITFYILFNFLAALAVVNILILLTFSVAVHELSHAYIARRYNIYIGEIIILPLTGVSIRDRMPENKLDELKIALVGPAVSFSIVLILTPVIHYFYSFDSVWVTRVYEFAPVIKLFQINLALTLFNIIPLYPLDGGRMLRSYLIHRYGYKKATKMVARITYVVAVVLIIIGMIFNLILFLLALLLYFAANRKMNFDLVAESLGVAETDERLLERQRYDRDRLEFIQRTERLRHQAEAALLTSSLSPLAEIMFRARTFYIREVSKGRLQRIWHMLISLLPLVFRIRTLTGLWLLSHQIRKSIIFMMIASASITLLWLFGPAYFYTFGSIFLLAFAFGAFIVYYSTRLKKLRQFTVIGCSAWILYLMTAAMEPSLHIGYLSFLYLEAFRGILVAITGIMFFSALINSNPFFKQANTEMPLLNYLVIITIFVTGTAVLFYEIYLISAYESDLSTVRFTLRYDIAYLIWFLASFLIFASLVYMVYLASVSRYGRITTIKATTATVIGILLLSFFGRDLFLLTLSRYSADPDELDMRIGLNAGNITRLDEAVFDDVFHLEVTWKSVYRKGPAEPNWSDTDWQLAYAQQKGIDIYFQVHPLPPGWFVEGHRDAIMVDQYGDRFEWIDQDPRSNRTDIWDLSFNDPEVLEAKLNFTAEAVSRYQNLSCIRWIGIQNEPTYPVAFNNLRIASYDEPTVIAFRDWMEARFDYDLEYFIEETGIEIGDWPELDAPVDSGSRIWDDWLEFREESLIWLVENLTATAKTYTDKPVTVKVMAHFLARYVSIQSGLSTRVLERFFELSDVVALDLYPISASDLEHSLEFYSRLAGSKRIIVPEFNLALGSNIPGSGSWLYYHLLVLNKYAEAVMIFTGGDHYIYGINLYEHTPVHLGLKLYKEHRADGDVFALYDELLYENLRSIGNYYEIYVFASDVWNIPVVPWPVLLIAAVPLPIVEEKKLRRAQIYKYSFIGILMLIFFILSNIPG